MYPGENMHPTESGHSWESNYCFLFNVITKGHWRKDYSRTCYAQFGLRINSQAPGFPSFPWEFCGHPVWICFSQVRFFLFQNPQLLFGSKLSVRCILSFAKPEDNTYAVIALSLLVFCHHYLLLALISFPPLLNSFSVTLSSQSDSLHLFSLALSTILGTK